MKMICDVPNEVIESVRMGTWCGSSVAEKMIANGIPLEQIRAEIDRQEKWLLQAGYTAYNTDIAFDAIKSVLAESEDKE